MSGDGGDKKYEASDRRREEFRKQGRFARSRDAAGLAAFGVVGVGLVASRAHLASAVRVMFSHTLGDLGALERVGLMRVLEAAADPVLLDIVPVLGASTACAIALAFAQVGFRTNPDAISPKMDRLDPAAGFQRLFAFKKNAIELALAVLRVGAVGYVAARAIRQELPGMLAAPALGAGAGAWACAGGIGRIALAVLVAMVVLSAVDYVQSWFSLQNEMRMSHQERMEETRQEEGDVKAKGRMKARARANAKRRALSGVKTADVIVTNPTHVAVAIRYGVKDPVPVVVAKGHDEVALRIRAEGRKWGIPIFENRPLARALDAQVPVGRPIPEGYFGPVAQVLAFVYRLKRRGAFGGTKTASR